MEKPTNYDICPCMNDEWQGRWKDAYSYTVSSLLTGNSHSKLISDSSLKQLQTINPETIEAKEGYWNYQ